MEDNFKLQIISPEKIVFSGDSKMVTIPSYEGDMSLLINHISIITFLRPGIIKVQNTDENFINFFVQDGTVEYFNGSLIILSASVMKVKDLSKEFLDDLFTYTEKKLDDKDLSDHDRYVLNHKLDTIREVRV